MGLLAVQRCLRRVWGWTSDIEGIMQMPYAVMQMFLLLVSQVNRAL